MDLSSPPYCGNVMTAINGAIRRRAELKKPDSFHYTDDDSRTMTYKLIK